MRGKYSCVSLELYRNKGRTYASVRDHAHVAGERSKAAGKVGNSSVKGQGVLG